MFNNKKCNSCNEKVDKKFRYCPWCGSSFRSNEERDNFGMLGKDDFMQDLQKELQKSVSLPGLDKMMSSLMKQLQSEMQKQGNITPGALPKGFSIQISTGLPNMNQIQTNKDTKPKKEIIQSKVSEKEKERRMSLKRKEAESSIRRLPDKVVYEIKCPGAKSKEDVVIAPLENGVEIRIYTKDFCYVKSIPMKIDILGFNVKDGKMFLDLKG